VRHLGRDVGQVICVASNLAEQVVGPKHGRAQRVDRRAQVGCQLQTITPILVRDLRHLLVERYRVVLRLRTHRRHSLRCLPIGYRRCDVNCEHQKHATSDEHGAKMVSSALSASVDRRLPVSLLAGSLGEAPARNDGPRPIATIG